MYSYSFVHKILLRELAEYWDDRMTIYHVLLLLVSAMSLSAASTGECCSCDVYEKLEEEACCGKNGYLLHYGLKNCRMFDSPEVISRFSEAGRKFVQCTRECLIKHLQNMFKKDRPTCDDIYDSAVDSHTDCYLKCGFCEICKTEKWALFKGYHVTDFFSVKSLKTVFRVLRACGPLSCLL